MMSIISRRSRCLPAVCAALVVLLLMLLVAWYLERKDIVDVRLKNGCLTIARTAGTPGVHYRVFDSDRFRTDHGLTLGGKSIERPGFIDLTLRVPFEVVGKSKLIIAEPNEGGHGFPVEAFRRLIVLPPSKGRATELLAIADLRGRVRIKSAEEALAFCRLLTSPVTCYYLDGRGVEMISKDQLDIGFFFGDKEEFSYYRSQKCTGMMGVVESKSDLKSLGIQLASVRKTSAGYEIRRTLLVEKDWLIDHAFVDVVETVEKDGSYSRSIVGERPVPSTSKYSFGIHHPM